MSDMLWTSIITGLMTFVVAILGRIMTRRWDSGVQDDPRGSFTGNFMPEAARLVQDWTYSSLKWLENQLFLAVDDGSGGFHGKEEDVFLYKIVYLRVREMEKSALTLPPAPVSDPEPWESYTEMDRQKGISMTRRSL